MPIAPFTITTAQKAMGSAEIMVGNAFMAGGGGMSSLGASEGTITVNVPWLENPLTLNEFTGEVAHQNSVRLGNVTIVVPMVIGDAALWSKIMPFGQKSGGSDTPEDVVTTTVLVIPRSELLTGQSKAVNPGAWTPGPAPSNAFWLWRAWASVDSLPYDFGNGGKVITPVTFHGMFDAARPNRHRVFTIGNPSAATPTAIDVII